LCLLFVILEDPEILPLFGRQIVRAERIPGEAEAADPDDLVRIGVDVVPPDPAALGAGPFEPRPGPAFRLTFCPFCVIADPLAVDRLKVG